MTAQLGPTVILPPNKEMEQSAAAPSVIFCGCQKSVTGSGLRRGSSFPRYASACTMPGYVRVLYYLPHSRFERIGSFGESRPLREGYMAWDTDKYNDSYRARRSTLTAIWREVYGDDYPEEAEPTCFVTKSDLDRIVQFLSGGPDSEIVDISCGSGGPGLYIARELQSNLVGVDFSEGAIEQAELRASDFGMSERARFVCADVCSTGLPSDRFYAAISIDALQMVSDIAAAMQEVARILTASASFAITTWESVDEGKGYYDSCLAAAGFEVEEHFEKAEWEQRQRAVCLRIIEQKAKIIEEMGNAAADPVIVEAAQTLGILKTLRHVMILARRK